MAKRKRSYGGTPPQHRKEASKALAFLRKAERVTGYMLKLGPKYCHGALNALLQAKRAETEYLVHRHASHVTSSDWKIRKGYISAGKRLTRLQARYEAACMR